uniref:Transposase n=1 Tax=Romanomermis culicivorax TaxID=13658 RepID=A0A915JPH7_ROMCU
MFQRKSQCTALKASAALKFTETITEKLFHMGLFLNNMWKKVELLSHWNESTHVFPAEVAEHIIAFYTVYRCRANKVQSALKKILVAPRKVIQIK